MLMKEAKKKKKKKINKMDAERWPADVIHKGKTRNND